MVVAICVLCFAAAVCLAAICSRFISNRRAPYQTLYKDPVLSPQEQMWFMLERELFRVEEHLKWLRQLKDKFVVALKDFRTAQENIAQAQSTRDFGVDFFNAQERLTEACTTTFMELPAACIDACVVELVKAYKQANRFRPKSLACRQTLKAMEAAFVEINSLIAEVKSLNDTATPLRELFPSSCLTTGTRSH